MRNTLHPAPRQRGACALLLSLGITAACHATELSITWWTIDAGGTIASSGAGYELSGTIGQPDASATLAGATWQLTGGFWTSVSAGLVGDCDGSGVLDVPDFLALADCVSGPQIAPESGCICADQDGDGDVDLTDAAALQRAFGDS